MSDNYDKAREVTCDMVTHWLDHLGQVANANWLSHGFASDRAGSSSHPQLLFLLLLEHAGITTDAVVMADPDSQLAQIEANLTRRFPDA